MNQREIHEWMVGNLLTKQEVMAMTGQSLSAFNQALKDGRITPFFEKGVNTGLTRLYLKEDAEQYAIQVIERRKRLQKGDA